MERRGLALLRLSAQTEHLRGRCLIEAGLWPRDAQGLQQVDGAEPRHLAGQQRLVPGCGNEGLRTEIVHLVRLAGLHHPD
jgi:hypothetical protein